MRGQAGKLHTCEAMMTKCAIRERPIASLRGEPNFDSKDAESIKDTFQERKVKRRKLQRFKASYEGVLKGGKSS